MRLAKVGYFNGDPLAILNAPVDIVQALIDYEGFEADYEKEYIALNQPAGGQ